MIVTVTVAVPPAASVPPADDKVTHVCVFAAVQLIAVPPGFVSVYDKADGLNGPPAVPEEDRPPAAATDREPDVAFTVRLTARVVFPAPLVVFVSVTVSL